jgi:hypothetical protein
LFRRLASPCGHVLRVPGFVPRSYRNVLAWSLGALGRSRNALRTSRDALRTSRDASRTEDGGPTMFRTPSGTCAPVSPSMPVARMSMRMCRRPLLIRWPAAALGSSHSRGSSPLGRSDLREVSYQEPEMSDEIAAANKKLVSSRSRVAAVGTLCPGDRSWVRCDGK